MPSSIKMVRNELSIEEFKGMLSAAATDFSGRYRGLLNRINFFPLPDKDTGTNVTPIIESFRVNNGAGSLEEVVQELTENISRKGAGWSGNIMDYFFQGFLQGIKKEGNSRSITAEALAEGFFEGYLGTISIEGKPRKGIIEEGTIVGAIKRVAFVAREYASRKSAGISEMIREMYNAAKEYVKSTPEKLKTRVKTNQGEKSLGEVGVVDSGSLAFFLWLAGIARYFGVRHDEAEFSSLPEVSLESREEDRYCIEIRVGLELDGSGRIRLRRGNACVLPRELVSQISLRYPSADTISLHLNETRPYLGFHGHFQEDCSAELRRDFSVLGKIETLKVDDMLKQSQGS